MKRHYLNALQKAAQFSFCDFCGHQFACGFGEAMLR